MNFPDKVMKHDFLSDQDKEDLCLELKMTLILLRHLLYHAKRYKRDA